MDGILSPPSSNSVFLPVNGLVSANLSAGRGLKRLWRFRIACRTDWASPRDLARLMRSVGAGRTCPAELRAARRASGPAQAREIARRGRITCVRHRPGAHAFGGVLEARSSPFYTQSENALARRFTMWRVLPLVAALAVIIVACSKPPAAEKAKSQ